MNGTDYIILAVLGLSVLVGVWRGLVSEVLALVIWIAAFWAAWVFGPLLALHLERVVTLPSLRIIGAYALCFIAVLVVGALLRFVARRLIDGIGLAGPDRLLGALFGLARGVLVVTLAVFLVGFTAFTQDDWWQRSVLLPHFRQAAVWMEQSAPADVGKYLHPAQVLEHLPSLRAPALDPILGSPGTVQPAPAVSVHTPGLAADLVRAGAAAVDSQRVRHQF